MRILATAHSALTAAIVLAAVVAVPAVALAQATQKSAGIYSCIDANGKKLTSDRPIAECAGRDQRLLNSDGSVRQIVTPVPTADERAAIEARQQEEALARAVQREAIRRDRNMLARFPNEAAHKKARESALDNMRSALRLSETRLAALELERKPLMDESEFYVGKPLPGKLKQLIDANEATTEAQRNLVQNQKAEIVRINDRYDQELERLRKLWSGAQPGSMGALPAAEPASAPRKTAGK
jgi:hypothetical protein